MPFAAAPSANEAGVNSLPNAHKPAVEIANAYAKKYKNISSTLLIKEVIGKIRLKNYEINNIDINVITETPRLKKFKNKIVNNISTLCGISSDKVNIKAKTTEKLGIIGQEKAIAAEVIVSVIKYE